MTGKEGHLTNAGGISDSYQSRKMQQLLPSSSEAGGLQGPSVVSFHVNLFALLKQHREKQPHSSDIYEHSSINTFAFVSE